MAKLPVIPDLLRSVQSPTPEEDTRLLDIVILTVLATLQGISNAEFVQSIEAEKKLGGQSSSSSSSSSSGASMWYPTNQGMVDLPTLIARIITFLDEPDPVADEDLVVQRPKKLDYFADTLMGLVHLHKLTSGDKKSLESTYKRLKTATSKTHLRHISREKLESVMETFAPFFPGK